MYMKHFYIHTICLLCCEDFCLKTYLRLSAFCGGASALFFSLLSCPAPSTALRIKVGISPLLEECTVEVSRPDSVAAAAAVVAVRLAVFIAACMDALWLVMLGGIGGNPFFEGVAV